MKNFLIIICLLFVGTISVSAQFGENRSIRYNETQADLLVSVPTDAQNSSLFAFAKDTEKLFQWSVSKQQWVQAGSCLLMGPVAPTSADVADLGCIWVDTTAQKTYFSVQSGMTESYAIVPTTAPTDDQTSVTSTKRYQTFTMPEQGYITRVEVEGGQTQNATYAYDFALEDAAGNTIESKAVTFTDNSQGVYGFDLTSPFLASANTVYRISIVRSASNTGGTFVWRGYVSDVYAGGNFSRTSPADADFRVTYEVIQGMQVWQGFDDDQTLAFNASTNFLSIEGGNSVDLSAIAETKIEAYKKYTSPTGTGFVKIKAFGTQVAIDAINVSWSSNNVAIAENAGVEIQSVTVSGLGGDLGGQGTLIVDITHADDINGNGFDDVVPGVAQVWSKAGATIYRNRMNSAPSSTIEIEQISSKKIRYTYQNMMSHATGFHAVVSGI